ncbi:2,3-diaminopropionate biosynthesis protein SbnB [Frankia sp. QA3]|uniref:2,3-diaminopropionate biosynthesis protein SbnB n=1 Tax=Frankia sp. QA3 TaxID=710111 RepID=UPI000269BD6E|nr:2,3-diaminopropionate biosynthesis protein SbnB [Frankia sp. QA3]EIV93026.1 2,3-diaminopropionate biosynthesis protein SbnB [Frankia sp. QA3]
MFEFDVVPGKSVTEILRTSAEHVLAIVRQTYIGHEKKETINPDSYFLRFPDRPEVRIIALPAYVGGTVDRAGIKWVSSFPKNIAQGAPRASAVLILNSPETGHPIACLEAAGISAARTAASAAVATVALARPDDDRRIAFVGAGVIAREIVDYLVHAGVTASTITCHDLDPVSAASLADHARASFGVPAAVTDSLAQALEHDIVVFATTASAPYVDPATHLRPDQLLLNVSLRDLPPQLLLRCNNIVDDVEHCLKADTSPHLAERLSGARDFITGTIGGALLGQVRLDEDRPTIVSPFGLGVLDIAVGHFVLTAAQVSGTAVGIPDFFGTTRRW